MKANRKEIQTFDIQGYLDDISSTLSLYNACNDIDQYVSTLCKLEERKEYWETYFFITCVEKQLPISKHYFKFSEMIDNEIKNIKRDWLFAEKKADYACEVAAYLGFTGETNSTKCKDFLKEYFEGWDFNIVVDFIQDQKDSILYDIQYKGRFYSSYKEKVLAKFENTNYNILDFIENGEIYTPVYNIDTNKVFAYINLGEYYEDIEENEFIKECAELLAFQELTKNTEKVNTENQSKNNISLNPEKKEEDSYLEFTSVKEKMLMLDSIGVFNLPYFDINPTNEKAISQRAQSRFLAKILDKSEPNIRKCLSAIRKNKSK